MIAASPTATAAKLTGSKAPVWYTTEMNFSAQSSQSVATHVIWMLACREWVRFFRQPFRVVAALGQPVLFWILFGTGMHGAFRGGQAGNFMTYFLPGTTAMILLFTAIFATISIIEDRREGFLQSVLVAPGPRWTIALGKVLGGSAIAWVQALVFVAIAISVGMLGVGIHTLSLIVFMFVAAMAMTSLGVCFAWPMDSTQGFHALMNLVLMPMWLLSGAFFPVPAIMGGEPVGQIAMHWIMRCNPMTYSVAGMRHLMSTVIPDEQFWMPTLATSVSFTIVFAVVALIAATMVVRRNQTGEFQ
jgi:ABC-2 type transport system permease protein